MAKFTGVWGTFEFLDETTETIEQVRNEGAVSYTHLTLPTICSV